MSARRISTIPKTPVCKTPVKGIQVGSQDEIRKHAEGLKLKSKSYFIWARIPQRHASNLRNLQGLNPEVLESYNGNCPYRITGGGPGNVSGKRGIPTTITIMTLALD